VFLFFCMKGQFMAYETLLPPDYEAVRNYGLSGDAYYSEYDGRLVRPYVSETPFVREEELGIYPAPDTYDPLTAPLSEVAVREWGSEQAYSESPTLWDRQSERAHHTAMARKITLSGLRRVTEYRAQQPRDTDTIQLRLVPPEPSGVEVALAELRDLRAEIATYAAEPPMFSRVQRLRTKQYETTPPPHAGPVTHGSHPSVLANAAATGPLPSVPPATVREPTRSSEALATQPAESELVGGSKDAVSVPDESSAHAPLWRIAWLSARGAKQLLGRIKRQAARI
jgi:hypothetical protein